MRPGAEAWGLRERILGWMAAGALRALRATLRFRFHGDEEVRGFEQTGKRFILVFWHRHMLLMPFAYQGSRVTTLSSWSRDGEISSQTLRRLGIEVVRGSSSRDAVSGLRRLLRVAKEGSDLGITPDGPRGPARVVQPGVAFLSRVTGFPMVPVAFDASRRVELRTWDRMLLPLPGAEVHFAYGPAVSPPQSEAQEAAVANVVSKQLCALEVFAARCAGQPCEA